MIVENYPVSVILVVASGLPVPNPEKNEL